MAAAKSSLIKLVGGNSSIPVPLKWTSLDSGANNVYFDVNGVDADKMVILGVGHSTEYCQWWIGTSDSRSSGGGGLGTKAYPYSAGRLGRLRLRNSTIAPDAQNRSKFKSTFADTEVLAIYVMGPFETARFKDSNGRINVCRGVTTAGAVTQATIAYNICGILLP